VRPGPENAGAGSKWEGARAPVVIEIPLPEAFASLKRLLRAKRGQSVLFPNLSRRPVVLKFDQRHGSSDGGAILLKACDDRLGLTQRLASCIVDARQAGKVEHSILDLVRQRLYGIACGSRSRNIRASMYCATSLRAASTSKLRNLIAWLPWRIGVL